MNSPEPIENEHHERNDFQPGWEPPVIYKSETILGPFDWFIIIALALFTFWIIFELLP